MGNEVKLEPCPNLWCVVNDPYVIGPDMRAESYAARCKCGIRGPERGTETDAIAACNTRPYSDQAAQLAEALERLILEHGMSYPMRRGALANARAALAHYRQANASGTKEEHEG